MIYFAKVCYSDDCAKSLSFKSYYAGRVKRSIAPIPSPRDGGNAFFVHNPLTHQCRCRRTLSPPLLEDDEERCLVALLLGVLAALVLGALVLDALTDDDERREEAVRRVREDERRDDLPAAAMESASAWAMESARRRA